MRIVFLKKLRMHWHPLISEVQIRILAQARSLNVQGPQRWEAYQYGTNRQPMSTGRDFLKYQRCESSHQHQRRQYRRNERSDQKKANWESEIGGIISDQIPPGNQSWSFRCCQTRDIVISKRVEAAKTAGKTSRISCTIASDDYRRVRFQAAPTTVTLFS